MRKANIIASVYLVIIHRFCFGDGKFNCEKYSFSKRNFLDHIDCQEDAAGDFATTIEIGYDGTKADLYDEDALGTYRFVGVTNEHNSPVYIQGDEEHTKGTKNSRSLILRDWKGDQTWFGTRSLDDDKKLKSGRWLKSECKEKDISNCKPDDWSMRTGDKNTETWDDENVFLTFNSGFAMASIIGIVAGVVVLIAIIAIVVVLVLKKKRTGKKSPKHEVGGPV